MHMTSNGHPTPEDDFKMGELKLVGFDLWDHDQPCRFGFLSLQQYRKWFSEAERRELAQAGLKLRRKKAAVVIRSQFQCVYVPA
jgi:hypothetical protein